MNERILSITGKPGLYRLISQGKNMLIVENLATGKRGPAYAHEKVISLADIAIYTTGEDMPLYDVFEKISAANEAKAVDMKQFSSDAAVREYFATIMPDFDQERVYTTDIRKVFSWYNQLIAAGITSFKQEDTPAEPAE